MPQQYSDLDEGDAAQVQGELEDGHQAAGRVPVTETVPESDGTVTVIDHT
ncbi:hypothetical protein [Spirillospora sp. CA-128828]